MQQRTMKRAAFILAPFAATVLASSALRAETRLAVIALPQSGADDLGDLVQLRLGERKDLALVERAAIKEILREQGLQSVMAANAPGKRATLGRLLKADTLVLLAGRQKPQPHVELVICETQRGLRLATEPLTRSGNLETDAAAVIKRVEDALARQQEKIREIVAVPPLLNRTLTREMDHLQGAYARLIEQSLLQRPGVLVVELSEAKAIAQEIFVSSSPGIERRLPLYLVGEFRVEGAGEKRRGQFSWKLLRGESGLDSRSVADLKVDDLPGRLQQAAQEMLDKAMGQAAKPPDAAAEIRQLTQRARAFAATGNWPETVALAEAGLLLAPDSVELHGHAFMGLNKMAEELQPFDRCKSGDDLLRALAYMRAALPHMEPYLRGMKLDVLHHLWCRHPWDRLSMRLAMPNTDKRFPDDVDPVEFRRLCVELWKELMPLAERVLAAKAAARVQDHSLYLLAPWTEPPEHRTMPLTADQRFGNEYVFGTDGDVSSICKHRLKLLENFTYLTDLQNLDIGVPRLLSPPWGRRDEPAYQQFLASVEKLPNEEMREVARAVRAGVTPRPRWMRGLSTVIPPPKPPADVVPNAEVVVRPLQLTIVDTDGREYPFDRAPGARLASWIKTADGIDAVLGYWGRVLKDEKGRSIYRTMVVVCLMKEKGRLIRLPLEVSATRSGMSLCRDGRFLWFVSPGTPQEVSDATAPQKRFLAVIDPRSEEITKLTADDGLPPMNHMLGGEAAITALGPGKVLVAGYFGRSWCGVASFNREKRIALDVFFEAHDLFQRRTPESAGKTAAFRIEFICTMNPPAGTAQSGGQRVLLGRDFSSERPPLLIDPEKRSVELLSERVVPSGSTTNRYSVHDGSFYWRSASMPQGFAVLCRIGYPDFRPEQVNVSAPDGPFLVCDNRVYVWHTGQLYMAPSFRGPFRLLQGSAPSTPEPDIIRLGLSHHYGMVVWGNYLNLRSLDVRFH